MLPCPFSGCNCEYRGRRTEIAQHLKDMPGIHLNLAGQTISIQKRLLEFFEERVTEQNNWIDLLARKVNAAEKTCGAQFIWKIDHYQVESKLGKKCTAYSRHSTRNGSKKRERAREQPSSVRPFSPAVMDTVCL